MTSTINEKDYVLGTHDEEIARLGLQHRVWRSRVLDCWRDAGITLGSRVVDFGAGPGYATVDLAEIVGSTGKVIAFERSGRFLRHAEELCRLRGLRNVTFIETDLMDRPPDASGMDAAWCRWVASFVSSPATLLSVVSASLRTGGVAIFHEYIHYATWRLAPRRPSFESFVSEVMDSWRATGGEPDVALQFPGLLRSNGLRIRTMKPLIYAITPRDYFWQWPRAFIDTGVQRLLDLGRVNQSWAESVRKDFLDAEADPTTMMTTPMVLEIVAEKM